MVTAGTTSNLSRLAADSGTVTSPLVPWNSCGAFMGSVLGVPTLAYLPYCFYNTLSPLLNVHRLQIERVAPAEEPEVRR